MLSLSAAAGKPKQPRLSRLRIQGLKAMLLVRLALSCTWSDGFGRFSAPIVPFLFPSFWGEPLG